MPKKSAKKRVAKKSAKKAAKSGLIIQQSPEGTLSPAQIEFNRVMKRLENARAKHARKEAQYDQFLTFASTELMPLIAEINRANCEIVFLSVESLETMKFSKKRRYWLADLICYKASQLLKDPWGLADEDLPKLEAVIDELEPPEVKEEAAAEMAEDFEFFRAMLEHAAHKDGLDIDLSDLDMTGDPDEIRRIIAERLEEAERKAGDRPTKAKRPRKQTKAQIEKARRDAEQEEIKKRDFKSLYKQLAKVLHPDLETDPKLKQTKETWMKRLTSAYNAKDLRDLLQIEMEWLGQESNNLAQAGDQKLKVYCSVLKEQIANLNRETEFLFEQPQYSALRRFANPFTGNLVNAKNAKLKLQGDLAHHRSILRIVQAGGKKCREMLASWADDNEDDSTDDFFYD